MQHEQRPESQVVAASDRTTAVVLLAGALLPAVAAVLLDPAGRLLAVPAAVVLAGLGLRNLVLQPVLRAGPDGLTVRTGLRRLDLDWEQVTGLRVVRDRRADLLEIDAGEVVLLLGRWRLGRPPQEVLDELAALSH